jgi:uncharacterized protein (TIGR02646 family)
VIRIEKPENPPDILITKGKQKQKDHETAYSREPEAYRSGAKKFKFTQSIYAHSTVKSALVKAQHRKCCYCEARIGRGGDVEHFRPKQAYCQAEGESLQYPGYYWLAYEWSNLYLACTICNQRHKQNFFPLQNPMERVSDHRSQLQREQPLLIDPSQENPEDFIGFRGEIPFAIDDQPKGAKTIEIIDLNRPNLQEDRLEKLCDLRDFYEIVQSAKAYPDDDELQRLAKRCQTRLDQSIQNDAKYAAAARSAIKTDFRYVIG